MPGDILVKFRYKVTIGGTEMSFSDVTGLAIQYTPVTYRHGLSFLFGEKIILGHRQPINVTLKQGVCHGRSDLSDWIKEVAKDPFSDTRKRDVLIDLVDTEGTALVRWKVVRALPVKLDAPGFNAAASGTGSEAIETLQVIGHDLIIEHL